MKIAISPPDGSARPAHTPPSPSPLSWLPWRFWAAQARCPALSSRGAAVTQCPPLAARRGPNYCPRFSSPAGSQLCPQLPAPGSRPSHTGGRGAWRSCRCHTHTCPTLKSSRPVWPIPSPCLVSISQPKGRESGGHPVAGWSWCCVEAGALGNGTPTPAMGQT